jgi:hypothetical protein
VTLLSEAIIFIQLMGKQERESQTQKVKKYLVHQNKNILKMKKQKHKKC